jgi:hypothetical protein
MNINLMEIFQYIPSTSRKYYVDFFSYMANLFFNKFEY